MLKTTLLLLLTSFLASCSVVPKQSANKEAVLIDPVTIQEDNWNFKYSKFELPGSIIDDGMNGQISAAGQWAVINFAVTNTFSKKQDVWQASVEMEYPILVTSDGQRWESPKEIYNFGLNTVQPQQSYNLKIAFDIPKGVSPKTLIYQFYDADYNVLEFEIPLK